MILPMFFKWEHVRSDSQDTVVCCCDQGPGRLSTAILQADLSFIDWLCSSPLVIEKPNTDVYCYQRDYVSSLIPRSWPFASGRTHWSTSRHVSLDAPVVRLAFPPYDPCHSGRPLLKQWSLTQEQTWGTGFTHIHSTNPIKVGTMKLLSLCFEMTIFRSKSPRKKKKDPNRL